VSAAPASPNSISVEVGPVAADQDDLSWVGAMFRTIDDQDNVSFFSYLSDDIRFRFGNGEAVRGYNQLNEALNGFYATIGALSHTIVGLWRDGDVVTVELEVSYDRLDGRQVTVPVISLLRVGEARKVSDYRIFFDLAPVYKEG